MSNEITAPITLSENNIVGNIVLSPIEINAPVQIGEDGVVLSVSDTGEILLSLVGGDLSAQIVTGGVDILKLDSGVQLSLGRADSALQSGDNISVLTNNSGYITGVDWGEITGTLTNQTDLQNALDAKTDDTTFNNHSTRHELGGADELALDTSQTTTGTFADARIAQSNVTQHEGALTAGSDNEIQYNNAGTFGADPNFTWDGTLLDVTGNIQATGLTDTTKKAGSVLFAGTGGTLTEDNANLFWDDTNNRLGIGTSSPDSKLTVEGNISLPQAGGSTITGEKTLTLQSENGSYGPTKLILQNEADANGPTFSTQGSSQDLIDFKFIPGSESPQNIRLEARGARILGAGNTAGEFQIGPPGDANFLIGDGSTIVRNGDFGIGTTTPNAKLQVDGSMSSTTETITTTTDTLDATNHIVLADDDTAGAEMTLTLPAASGNNGLQYIIKKIGTTANVVIDGSGTETIDGATTSTLTTQYESITIVCNGSNWFVIQ